MSDILQLLTGAQPGTYVESGVVLTARADGTYTVSINGRSVAAEATVSAAGLVPGARVVINRTSTGRYIIGTSRQFTAQKYKEIVVDG